MRAAFRVFCPDSSNPSTVTLTLSVSGSRHSGCFLHGDLRVRAAPPAVALQRPGAAPADARPQEAHGGRVRSVAAAARLSGDGALVGARPAVQIIGELH